MLSKRAQSGDKIKGFFEVLGVSGPEWSHGGARWPRSVKKAFKLVPIGYKKLYFFEFFGSQAKTKDTKFG